MRQSEMPHGGTASIADPIPKNARTLRAAKIGVRQIDAGRSKGIRRQLDPQPVRTSTPDHVRVEVKAFVEWFIFMEIVLEADD
jgi:hypothetical protein